MNIPDSLFGFLDEESEGSSCGSNNGNAYEENELEENDVEERENSSGLENKNFWETQSQLLQATLYRTSSIESKVRSIVKEVIKEAHEENGNGSRCVCKKTMDKGCRSCLMKQICVRLQNAGYNGAICKSKWKSSPEIPSGEHTFLDVVDNSNSKKEVRVIIELNFRAEFEMARASEEYNQLIRKLPEVFVAKTERLSSLIKVLCSAAKKCMKDKKMHLGPWRKQRYMQAKWFRICERTTAQTTLSTEKLSRPARPKVRSMLTVDLLENISNVHRTAVAVV